MISQIKWCNPVAPTPPMYIPGRLRTGSSPSRTTIFSPPYDLDFDFGFGFDFDFFLAMFRGFTRLGVFERVLTLTKRRFAYFYLIGFNSLGDSTGGQRILAILPFF